MKTSIQIAQSIKLKPIKKIAQLIGIKEKELYFYGPYKAKVISDKLATRKKTGKLVLVTAINPTSAGEGKTTTTIGLGQALFKMNKKAMICLRQPSMGPCFGVKGGATGGGKSMVLPMDEININFTGDIHAVGVAHNLLSAMVDNSIYQGNKLNIDPQKVSWRRVVDVNDRALRQIKIVYGKNGEMRDSSFDITVASEIMAVLCLSRSLTELKERLAKIIVATTYEGKPVTAKDLKAEGSMALILKDALNPNLVQTMEGSPAFVHGGPFANIAHGCSSLMATQLALKLTDYVITEAGFGADLGAEKFLDIKCRMGNLKPSAVVIVASVRALRLNGDGDLEKGLANLGKHLENMAKFGLPVIVAVNRFPQDLKTALEQVEKYCRGRGVDVSLSEVFTKGSKGGFDLAEKVLSACDKKTQFRYLYQLDKPPKEIIEIIAREIYGANGVEFAPEALADLKQYRDWGLGNMPVCMAKTQYSLSDDPKKLGRPTDFKITVNRVRVSNGAGFYVAITGNMMTMPGLPKVPAAENIDIDEKGKIKGLF